MNEYSLALDFLSKQENGAEHKEAIIAYVKALQEESKEKATRLREASAKLRRLVESAGGTEEDLEKTVAELQKQVKDLTTERDNFKTSSEANIKELETLKAEKVQREKEARMRSLSEKAGADYEAFNQLFADTTVELVGETVTVKEGDKSLSLEEYLQGQPAWKRAALFSSKNDNQQNNQQGKLPSAPTSGGQSRDNGTTVGESYINSRYSASRFGKK